MSLLRLSHIGICVADRQRSLAFYRDILEFHVISEIQIAGEIASTLLQIDGVDLEAVYLERDGVRIELLHFRQPGYRREPTLRPLNRLGLTHLSFRVDDFEAMLRRLRDSGVAIVDASKIDFPAVGAAAVFITDPDGTLIELVQSPGDPNLLPGQ